MSSGRKRRLPVTVDFGADGSPSWAEFRRVWSGQTVTLVTDAPRTWRGTLVVPFTVNDGAEVFVLDLDDGRQVSIGCDTVIAATV